MTYLQEQLPKKEHPNQVLPQCNSSIVFIKNYYPHPQPLNSDFPLKSQRIAKYAQGEDYHFWLKSELQSIIAELKQERITRDSPFYKVVREKGMRPYRLIKYCMGIIELYGQENIKYNRFKKKLLRLNNYA